MSSVEIDLDDTYEIEVTYFAPGTPPGWDEAGAGAEIELGDTVKVWGLDFVPNGPGSGNAMPMVVDVISLDEFTERYAAYHGVSKKDAGNKLESECIELMTGQLEDDYDDRDV